MRLNHALSTLLIAVAGVAPGAAGLHLEDQLSPLSRERPRRRQTRFIILHTTEGAPKGAIQKLREYGEAHYLVLRSGKVLRIVDKARVAYHAGRSMWAGREELDRISLGIEVVGYHNRPLRAAQVTALRELIRQLRGVYGIPASRVLTHAHVAYGAPNRYHRYRHRGRKRCAMNLATPAMRRRLGLGSGPVRDPDVRAGRLRVADPVLYGRLFKGAPPPRRAAAARELRPRAAPPARAASARSARRQARPPARSAARSATPAGVYVFKTPGSAERRLGGAAAAASTVYLFPDGVVRSGVDLARDRAHRSRLRRTPAGTRVLRRVLYAGYVKPGRPPSVLCGPRWRSDKSWYRLPSGQLRSGSQIQAAHLPRATMAFCAR